MRNIKLPTSVLYTGLLSFASLAHGLDLHLLPKTTPIVSEESEAFILGKAEVSTIVSPQAYPGKSDELMPQLIGIEICGSEEAFKNAELNQRGILLTGIDLPGSIKDFSLRIFPFLGKSLTQEDLIALKRAIILFYRDCNHPLVTVYVPEQDVTDGILALIVRESVLGDIKVYNNKKFSKERYANAIQLKKGEPIDENLLLNNLNFLNRNPFRRADLVYAPGTEPNTTDVELIVKDRFPLMIYAGVDNTGLVHTDRTRLFAGFTVGNAFNWDQIFSLQFTSAPDPHNFKALTANYTVPLPIQHVLQFYGGYSEVHVHVPYSSKTHGTSGQASVRYDIPVAPSPWLLHEFVTGFDFKRSNNTVEFVESIPLIGQEVNLTQFTVGYNLGYERDHKNFSHKVGFDAQLFFSPFSWIPNQSKEDFQSLNPHADPTYVYGRTSLNYKLRMPKNFVWSTLIAAQVSNRSLLPSEQFGLGGYNTVRGYEERQLNADDGLLISTEFHSPKIGLIKRCKRCKLNDGLEFLAFLDYGLAHDIHKMPGEKRTDYLLGVGPGLRYAIENYFSARVDWGVKLHREDFPGGWSMVHFSVIGSF